MLHQLNKTILVFLWILILSASSLSYAIAPIGKARVSGFARSFPFGSPITNAKIKILETGEVYKTDAHGNFGPIYYSVGKPITLVLSKFGYKTTQSATVAVPPEGLTSPYNNITFQVPHITTYHLMIALMGATIDNNSCHVTATITGYQKTLNDDQQGEAGAIAVLTPHVDAKPFYFDIFIHGVLAGRTNPLSRGLTHVTADGGIAYFNLQPSDIPYTLSAVKGGFVFSSAQFLCRKGVFINISPPRGPSRIK